MSELENIDTYLNKVKHLYHNCSEEKRSSIVTCLDRLIEDSNNEKINKVSLQIKCVDEITDLPNRESLIRDLDTLKDEGMLIILHINHLNILKELNGYDYLKGIVKEKTKQLQSVIDKNEASLYSLNLQEFAIFVSDKIFFEKYFSILKYSIIANMEKDIHKNNDGTGTVLDFTAGVAYSNMNLFHKADVVLQEAILSKVSFKIYEDNQESQNIKKSTLDRLAVYKQALYDGNVIPYFQPILDSKNEAVTKYEALARLKTDNGEIITPYYFLSSAIQDKTFEYFTRQMMQKVFNIYAKSNIEISINLSYENISSPSMVDYIRNRLDKYGGNGITFEILESEEVKEYAILENFIIMIKDYGCKVSIDDFGSGYSNFTNVIKLNIDFIKIDGTLVEQLNSDEKVFLMVKGIIEYAKNTGIKTIAEYVSSKEIADTVKSLGVDYLQGYYYGEPKSAKEYNLI